MGLARIAGSPGLGSGQAQRHGGGGVVGDDARDLGDAAGEQGIGGMQHRIEAQQRGRNVAGAHGPAVTGRGGEAGVRGEAARVSAATQQLQRQGQAVVADVRQFGEDLRAQCADAGAQIFRLPVEQGVEGC